MTRVLRLALALGFAVASLVLIGSPAHACSCAVLTPTERAETFDQVFVGTVSESDAESEGDADGPGGIVTYDVAVQHVYKGDVASQQAVATASSSAACGLPPLPEGEAILFFTSSRPGESADPAAVLANACSGTGPASDDVVRDVEAVLGAPSDPAPTPGEAAGPDGGTKAGPPVDEVDDASGGGTTDGIGADDGKVLWPVLGALVLLGAGVATVMTRRRS